MSKQYDVAVVGATGAVGETMMSILEERDFPVRTLYPLASA
ncbi:MAG TPA: aspartate-semialdehyde dehydrogenase, partial [Halieaceae bacterium]|nr:aspartate-semialdehyde dehydrogenase [Halieaceae bacterium]